MARRGHPGAGRIIVAALLFALVYLLLFPPILLLCTAVLTWETLRWLLASVLLVPVLGAIGLWGLLPGLPLIGLLTGAIAVRWPDRRWPRLLVAVSLPLVELVLVRRTGVPHLASRVLLLLMGRRAVLVLGSIAPALSSGLAALLVPRRVFSSSPRPAFDTRSVNRDQCPDR